MFLHEEMQMRRRMKMDGYVDEPGPVLNGELRTDYTALHQARPRGEAPLLARTYLVVLKFGDEDVAAWDVTNRVAEFEDQPGDYRSVEEQEDRRVAPAQQPG